MKLHLLAIRQTKRTTDNSSDLQAAVGASGWISLLQRLKTSRFKTATSLHTLGQQLLVAVGSNTEALDSDEDMKRDKQNKRKAEDTKETDAKRTHRKKAKRSNS